MKVFVTDDHDVMFKGYESLLSSYGSHYEMIGTSKNGQELLDWLENNTCDVVLLDLSMPVMNGIEVLRTVYGKSNLPKFIIVSGNYNMKQIQEAIVLGAKGFILKDEVHEVLEEALLRVMRGKKFFSEAILDEIILRQLENDNTLLEFEDIFSNKELQVLQLMTENIESGQICKQMKITKSSYNTFTARMREKLGIKKNVRLILLALKYKLNTKK